MDVHNKKTRSYNMSKIRARNTGPETIVAELLKDLGIPFLSHDKSLPGTPDFYLPDYNLIIDVHGCFWHSHKHCRYFILPKQNKDFWEEKLNANCQRDSRVRRMRRKAGIQFLIIWECEIKNGNYYEKILSSL